MSKPNRLIHSKEDWQKVRKLAQQWYMQVEWQISNKVLAILAISFLLLGYLIKNLSVLFLLFAVFTIMKLFARLERIEGYVDGWNEAQDYLQSDTPIDQLLDKPHKKKK